MTEMVIKFNYNLIHKESKRSKGKKGLLLKIIQVILPCLTLGLYVIDYDHTEQGTQGLVGSSEVATLNASNIAGVICTCFRM